MHHETGNSSQSQRSKILAAAFRCISTKGYANVSLRDIADEAGVVLSQLNYYYKNKEGLFTEVVKLAIQNYLGEMSAKLRQGATVKEKMASLIAYFQEMLRENPELFRMLYDFIGMSIWSDSFAKLLSQLFKDLCVLIESNVLKDLPINDKFKNYSSKTIARMIIGVLFGLAIQSILDPEKETFADALNMLPIVFE